MEKTIETNRRKKKDNLKRKAGIFALMCLTAAGMLGLAGCGDNPYGNLDWSEYLEVGDYKGVEAEAVSVEVEKADIADEINAALEAATENVELKKGDTIKEKDTVTIDYTGKVNGKTFDGGSAEDYQLKIGSGTFIDGFEEGLVGREVGEKGIKLDLAFPPDYSNESLQGKDVEFTVKIKSATRPEQPEFNDEFAQSQGDYKTTEEYEKAVEKNVYNEKKKEADSSQQTEIWSQVLEDTKVKKYPQDMVDHYVECFDEQIDYYAEQYGTDRDTIISQYYGVSSEKELKKQLKDYAKVLVKQEMLIEYIAEKENISYTKEEAESLQSNIEAQGYDEESVERETGRNMDEYVHIELLYEKVLEYLQDNADIK